MAGTVWSKFFWADWLSDAGLRACSATARGVWMDMLCVAAAHDPPGYVAFSASGLTEIEISRLTGEPTEVVRTAIAELERNKVFARTRQGTIYSRRMVRDFKRAEISRKNGKSGGNPSLRKDKAKSAQDNQPDKAGVTPNGARARVSISHMPRANSHKPEDSVGAYAPTSCARAPPPGSAVADDWPPDYREQFAAAYPHKVGMAAALRQLEDARIKLAGAVTWRIVMDAVATYAETKPPDRQWANPKTWITEERWNDRPAPQPAGNGRAKPSLADVANALIAEAEERERSAGDAGREIDRGGGDPAGDADGGRQG